jgi:hypothetical protein
MMSKMTQQHIRDVLTDLIVAIRSMSGKALIGIQQQWYWLRPMA